MAAGTTASAAVGASSLLVTCLIGIFTGLSAGTSVAVSHAVGAKKRKRQTDWYKQQLYSQQLPE